MTVYTPVVHSKKAPFDVYIGRPSKWGNPFVIGRDGTREEVVAKFLEWVIQQPHLMTDIHLLHGKTLGCFCAPQMCHGDVLAELADLNADKSAPNTINATPVKP